MTMKMLGPNEAAPRRPFTSPALYERDLAILAYMLEDLRGMLGFMADDALGVVPYDKVEWFVHGLKRRAVVCNPVQLGNSTEDLCVVGFFGERHLDRDGEALEEVNAELMLEFRSYPGILSYSSIELPDSNWANLVVHDLPEAREYWRASQKHADAATRLSPLFYRTVRIHNGVLPKGLHGGRSIVVERTKYWDFRSKKVWQALRELDEAAASDPDRPRAMHASG